MEEAGLIKEAGGGSLLDKLTMSLAAKGRTSFAVPLRPTVEAVAPAAEKVIPQTVPPGYQRFSKMDSPMWWERPGALDQQARVPNLWEMATRRG
jgi:hypothetical protein